MSLVVGIEAREGIVVASDSQYLDELGMKEFVPPNYPLKLMRAGKCALGMVGHSKPVNLMVDKLQRAGICESGTFDEVAALVQNTCWPIYQEWTKDAYPEKRDHVEFMVAGYSRGQPKICSLSSGCNFQPILCRPVPCCIGRPLYARFLLRRCYTGLLDLDKVKSLAVFLIAETKEDDAYVGGEVHLAVVTPDGYFPVDPTAVKQITEANGRISNETWGLLRKHYGAAQ